jgi:hypothetical protein
MGKKNIFYGILVGLIIYVIIGSIGLYLLRICWKDYAIASKDKSYTFEMMLCRLLVGVIASIITGISTTKITKDKGKNAWLVGAIIFCSVAYIHFILIWKDYPAWYHFAYLTPIIPIIGLSPYFFIKRK